MSEETKVEIPNPQFTAGDIVEPTSDAAIRPKSRVGRVESRSWTEFRDQPAYWRYTIRWPEGGTSSEDDKHLQKSDAIACDLKVVVGGVPTKIETTTTATVGEVVARVLELTGAHRSGDVVEWDLRTEDGRQLTHLVGDAGLVDGETTLFLDPQVGGGGDQPGANAWQGTPPAEGTRRALIRDTIERTFAGKVFPKIGRAHV